MPKVNFKVIHASSQDERYFASSLNDISPTARGWHSSKFCLYPQDLVFDLGKSWRILRLQLVVHQYLIPAKIELYVGDVAADSIRHVSNIKYHRLGYISLLKNDKSNFKHRELKSIDFEAVGSYIKLVLHKNHINDLNQFNQVGLVAVNVIGDTVISSSSDVVISNTDSDKNKAVTTSAFSPYDDIGFDMAQDPEISDIVRRLHSKLEELVSAEQFEKVVRVQKAISRLVLEGEQLAKFEVQKVIAINEEKYELANKLKKDIESRRFAVIDELNVSELLLIDLPDLQLNRADSSYRTFSDMALNSKKIEDNTFVKSEDDEVRQKLSTPVPAIKTKKKKSPDVGKTSQNYDDLPLPTHRSSIDKPVRHSTEEVNANQAVIEQEEDDKANDPPPTEGETLTNKDLREASEAIEVFDLPLVTKAYSKTATHRSQALEDVIALANSFQLSENRTALKFYRAALFLAQRGVEGLAIGMFESALKLSRVVMTTFADQFSLDSADLHYGCCRILPDLIQKTGETAQRLRDPAKAFILEMSKWPRMQLLQDVPHFCLKSFQSNCLERLAVSRVETASSLYHDHQLQHGVTLPGLVKFAAKALEHRHIDVRRAAETLLMELYTKHDRDKIRKYLRSYEDKTNSMPAFRKLFDQMHQFETKK